MLILRKRSAVKGPELLELRSSSSMAASLASIRLARGARGDGVRVTCHGACAVARAQPAGLVRAARPSPRGMPKEPAFAEPGVEVLREDQDGGGNETVAAHGLREDSAVLRPRRYGLQPRADGYPAGIMKPPARSPVTRPPDNHARTLTPPNIRGSSTAYWAPPARFDRSGPGLVPCLRHGNGQQPDLC